MSFGSHIGHSEPARQVHRHNAYGPKRWRMSFTLPRLVTGLAVVCLASIVIAVLMASVWDVKPDTLWFEIGKVIAQTGLVTGLGVVASLLTFEYQGVRQQQQSRQEWLRSVLERADTAYTDVKRARRLLRSSALTTDQRGQELVLLVPYHEQMTAISEAQIDFETLRREVRASSAVMDLAPLGDAFQSLEDILDELITEWEKVLKLKKTSSEELKLKRTELKELDLFLASPSEENGRRFERGFGRLKENFIKIQRLILERLFDFPVGSLPVGFVDPG
jgi:hypothetical protein